MDEVSLYRREALESLRGPLEDRYIVIARSGGSVAMPSRFALIAAMNPCPCGHLWDEKPPCSCSQIDLLRHERKLSGPLLDRFDMQIGVERVRRDELMGPPKGPVSASVRERVCAAREMQAARFGTRLVTNASAPRRLLEGSLKMSRAARQELSLAFDEGGMSGRGLDRSLKLARTIADLEGSERIELPHMSLALSLRVHDAGDRAA